MKYWYLFGLLLLGACGQTTHLKGFDAKSWKEDKNGCAGIRQKLAADFEKVRMQLKGLDEMEIIDELGKPDLQRLDERQTKAYLYYIQPAPTCSGGSANARVVVIRFSAINRAFEIAYDQGTPF